MNAVANYFRNECLDPHKTKWVCCHGIPGIPMANSSIEGEHVSKLNIWTIGVGLRCY